MLKKFVAVLFVGFMFILVACNGAREDERGTENINRGPIVRPELSPDNPVTITVWITSFQEIPAEDNKISALLRENFGITLEYEMVIPDLMHRSIGPSLARRDFPDLIGTIDEELRFLEGDALIRLDEYLDTGLWPNLLEHVAPYRRRLTYQGDAVEPGLYIIPRANRFYSEPIPTTHWGAGFWIQKSVLSYLGYPDLTNMTLERYFEMIEIYKQSHPQINDLPTVGFTFPTQPGFGWDMSNPPMYLQGSTNTGNVIVSDDLEVQIYADSEYARRYFEILNRANARGLLDPNIFEQSQREYMNALAGGNVLGMYDRRWMFQDAHLELVNTGQWERTWVTVMPTFDDHEPNYGERPFLFPHQGFGISTYAKNPEIILTFLDVMLSEEWQIILSWGIAEEDFYVDEDGVFYRSPEQRRNRGDAKWHASNRLDALFDILPKRQGRLSCGNAFLPGEQPGEFWATLSAFDRAFLESYNKSSWQDFLSKIPEHPSYYPIWQIELGQNPDAHIARAELSTLTREWVPILVKAEPEEFNELWEEYLAEIQEINIQAFTDALSKAIREHVSLHGE